MRKKDKKWRWKSPIWMLKHIDFLLNIIDPKDKADIKVLKKLRKAIIKSDKDSKKGI